MQHMQAQRIELLNQLPEHGWRAAGVEDGLDWWADEMWLLESVWSPVGSRAYVTFLVDPQFDGPRKKGEAVWAVMASPAKPMSRQQVEGEFTLTLGQGWKNRLPDLFDHLSSLRSQNKEVEGELEPWEVQFERERLHSAAQHGDVEEVRRLLEQGYQLNLFDDLGKTPLHYAAMGGHLDVLNVLLAAGADVNAHDERVIGNTPLREVADTCSFEVAKILVDAGADPAIPGWMQLTALHKARERVRPEGRRVCELLEQAAKRLGKAGT